MYVIITNNVKFYINNYWDVRIKYEVLRNKYELPISALKCQNREPTWLEQSFYCLTKTHSLMFSSLFLASQRRANIYYTIDTHHRVVIVKTQKSEVILNQAINNVIYWLLLFLTGTETPSHNLLSIAKCLNHWFQADSSLSTAMVWIIHPMSVWTFPTVQSDLTGLWPIFVMKASSCLRG